MTRATHFGTDARLGAARVLVGVAAILLVSSHAATAEEARGGAAPPVRLVTTGEMPRILEGAVLRGRLAAELVAPVALDADLGSAPDGGVLRIAYDDAADALTVTFEPIGAPALSRTITAGGQPDEVADLAVLLAGNLTRDQSAELLADEQPAPTLSAAHNLPSELPSPSDPTVASHGGFSTVTPGHRLRTEAWVGTLSLINTGVRISGQHFYALANVSAHVESGKPLGGAGFALGAVHACYRAECGVDLGTTYLLGGNDPGTGYTLDRLISRVRVLVGFSPTSRLTLFTGAGFALTTHLYHKPDNVSQAELYAGIRL